MNYPIPRRAADEPEHLTLASRAVPVPAFPPPPRAPQPATLAALLLLALCLTTVGCTPSQLDGLRDTVGVLGEQHDLAATDLDVVQQDLEALPDSDAKNKALARLNDVRGAVGIDDVGAALGEFQAAVVEAIETAEEQGDQNIGETLLVVGSGLTASSPWVPGSVGVVGGVIGAVLTSIGRGLVRRKEPDGA